MVKSGITATTVLLTLLAIDALILLVATGHLMLGEPFKVMGALFSLQNEPTIPGWYASVKLLLVSLLLGALSLSIGRYPAGRAALLGAAFLFLLMSCDESAGVHERLQFTFSNRVLTGVTDHIYDAEVLGKVVVGLTAFAVAAFLVIAVVRTLRSVKEGRLAFGAGFLLLAAGAVGVDLTQEFVTANAAGFTGWVVLEELFEMVGVTLMIYGGLRALASGPVTLELGSRLRARAADLPE